MSKINFLFCTAFALFAVVTQAAPFPRTATVPAVSARTIQSETAPIPNPNLTATQSVNTISYQLSNATFEQVKLTDTSILNHDDKKMELKPISYGIRKKKVFGLIPLKVYVIEFLSARPNLIDKNEDKILTSLKKSQAVQLKLTMSRDLAGNKITDSFKEALDVNGVDLQNPSQELSEVMNELSAVKEFKSGETFSLLATWDDPQSTRVTLYLEKPDHSTKVITGDEKLITDLFSIWFGKPADDKLADLKKVLLK